MLRFKRNGTDVFSFGDDGKMTAAVLLPGQAVNRIQAGEINFFCNGLPVLETGTNSAGGREVHIRGKHHPQLAPDTGIIPLRLIAPGGTAAASISYGGALKHTGTFTGTVKTATAVQPYKPGNYSISGGGSLTYKAVTYATRYAGYPAPFDAGILPNLSAFLNPTPGFEITRTIDLTGFIEPGTTLKAFSFSQKQAPLFGHLTIPDGPGPFPVVVLIHGNYLPSSDMDSAAGFKYLCNHLASLGFIALSVSHDYLNRMAGPGSSGENTYSIYSRIGARALVMLENLRQLGHWNATPGHPLYKRVDMGRITAGGHSQGGETIYYAGYFNMQRSVRYATVYPSESESAGLSKAYGCDVSQVPAWPASRIREIYFKNHASLSAYCFYLRSFFFVGTVGNTYKHVANDSTATFTRPTFAMENLVMYGSHDNDSNMYEGFCIKSRLTPPEQSYALCVEMANHNFFNAQWINSDSGIDPALLLPRATHQNILKSMLAAFALKTLHGQTQLHDGLQNCRLFVSSNQLPSNILYMNYNVPAASQELLRTIYKNTSTNEWVFTCNSVSGGISGNFQIHTSRTKANALTHIALDNKYYINATLNGSSPRLQFALQARVSLANIRFIEIVLFYTSSDFSTVESNGTPQFNLELAYGSTAVALPSTALPLPKATDTHLKCLLPQTYRFDMSEYKNRQLTQFDRLSLTSLSGKSDGVYCMIHEVRVIV